MLGVNIITGRSINMDKAEAKKQGEKVLAQVRKFDETATMKLTDFGSSEGADWDYTIKMCNGALNMWMGGVTHDSYFCSVSDKYKTVWQESAKTPKAAFNKLYNAIEKKSDELDRIMADSEFAKRNILFKSPVIRR